MSTLIDSRIPSAQAFNAIPHFDEQVKSLDSSVLSAIAQIFVSSGASKDFGAGILHRHQTLTPGQAIIHTISNKHVDIAEIKDTTAMNPATLKGTAFFLNKDNVFQPFEFGTAGAPELDLKFAAQLQEYLVKNNLQQYVAVVPNPHKADGMGNMLEYTILDGKVNIRIPHRIDGTAKGDAQQEQEGCEWGFTSKGAVEATICKGEDGTCQKDDIISVNEASIIEATICKGGDTSCNNASITEATICKGDDPSCNSVAVTEATICKGDDPSCNSAAITICKGDDPSCNYASIYDVTICKGDDPSCTQAAAIDLTICKGAGDACQKGVTSIVEVVTPCEWSFAA